MAKPDRDRSEAKLAEDEYQTFLSKYPKDPLAPKAEQHLRDVQEIIAEGDYRIAYFYYVKGDKRAAAARMTTIAKRYPLFSKSDKVLWMLGDIFEKSEHKEIASIYYGNILKNYPLSDLAGNAKGKLVTFKVPVPQPDPKAVAWMTAEQNTPRKRDGLVKRPLALVRTAPHGEIIASAKSGAPNLEPEADTTSATDILSGGGKSQLGGAGGGRSGARNTAVVETVTPGGSAPTATESAAPAVGTAPASGPAGASADAAGGASTTAPAAEASSGTGSEQPAKAAESASGDTQATDANKTDASQSTDDKKDSKKESSSKKKKGLKKVLPW